MYAVWSLWHERKVRLLLTRDQCGALKKAPFLSYFPGRVEREQQPGCGTIKKYLQVQLHCFTIIWMSLSFCLLCGLRTIFKLEYGDGSQSAMLIHPSVEYFLSTNQNITLSPPPQKIQKNRGMIFDLMELRTLLEKKYSEQIKKQINLKLQL